MPTFSSPIELLNKNGQEDFKGLEVEIVATIEERNAIMNNIGHESNHIITTLISFRVLDSIFLETCALIETM